MLTDLFTYIQATCDKYDIDESHGLKHAMGIVTWAERLMENLDVSEDERTMIIYAAALHDMCDSKYRNVTEACDEIYSWLRSIGWSDTMAGALIHIVSTMSYSKLKKRHIIGEPFAYPNHGIWQRAYHIVRHADLLEAYKVVRCYIYSKVRKPELTEDQLWLETERIFDERVFKYVSDGWIFLESALAFVPELEVEARRCLKMRDTTYVI